MLTPENLREIWIHFEAGALSKTVDEQPSRLWTYLYDLKPSDVLQPLGQFQHTIADKEDTRKLIKGINNVAEKQLSESQLNMVFESCWPNLEKTLQSVPKAAPTASAKRSLESMVEESLHILRSLRREHEEKMTEERRANLIRLLSQRPISLSETARIAEFLTLGEALKKGMKSEDKSEETP